MPELPEVETLANDLKNSGLCGLQIRTVTVFWPKSVAVPDADRFCRQLRGQVIAAVGRRGKYLIWDFESGWSLLIHLRMSGRLHFSPPENPRTPHEHGVFGLGDGRELRFEDPRKFGRLYLLADKADILHRLGPEPLEDTFDCDTFMAALQNRRRVLKPLLLDQTFLAGLGNIYVDEALWEARLHPLRQAAGLQPGEAKRLHAAIRRVLRRGIANLGTTLGTGKANFYSVAGRRGRNQDQLKVFRRAHLPCPRCQTPIVRMVVGRRGTHLCPQCQSAMDHSV